MTSLTVNKCYFCWPYVIYSILNFSTAFWSPDCILKQYKRNENSPFEFGKFLYVGLNEWNEFPGRLGLPSWSCWYLVDRDPQKAPTYSEYTQSLKWFLTKPGWSKPHTHSNPTNLALFRHKITLYRFNQGGSYYCRGGGSNGSRGWAPRAPSL